MLGQERKRVKSQQQGDDGDRQASVVQELEEPSHGSEQVIGLILDVKQYVIGGG